MSIIVFLLSFVLYLFTLSPSFSVGDAGEFCASSVILGLAHSPGYPLFSLIGKMCAILLPWGNLAYRVNMVSALCGAGTVTITYLLLASLPNYLKNIANFYEWSNETPCHSRNPLSGISRYIRNPRFPPEPCGNDKCPQEFPDKATGWNRFIAAFSALMLAISPAFWNSSTQTEVFTLNTLFAALIIYSAAAKRYYLSAFLFGLGMGNHHTLIFILPFILLAAYKDRFISARRLSLALVFFTIGFSIYLYLPVRSFANPGLDWGNPETPHNIWRVISRADYGSMSLTTGEKLARNASITVHQLSRFLSIFNRQFTAVGILAGVLGCWLILKQSKERSFDKLVIASWLISGPGFILLANIPFNAESEGILERFYIFSNLLWVFPLWHGLTFLSRKKSFAPIILSILLPIIFLSRLAASNMRSYYLAYDYGRNLLRTLAPGSIFFMDGGDDTFYSMAYFNFAERRRPDIELHDRGGLVFKNIYGADFRSLPRDEKEKRRQDIESTFINRRAVYYSTFNRGILPQTSMTEDGTLYRVPSAAQKYSNSLSCYSLRGVFEYNYSDYRSKALVPVYPYFLGLQYPNDKRLYWDYALTSWPEASWLKGNLKIELAQDAYKAFSTGDLAKAQSLYLWMHDVFPEDTSGLVNLGVIEERRNNPQKAKEYYLKAIEINPAETDAYYNLAVIAWHNQDWDTAVKNFRKILERKPNDERALRYLPAAEEKLRR